MSVMRWIKSGKIKTSSGRLPSGQIGRFVSVKELKEVQKKGASRTPKWKVFERNCLRYNCDQWLTLDAIIYNDVGGRKKTDADIAACGMRLILNGNNDFLLYLSGQKTVSNTHESQLAKLIGINPDLLLTSRESKQRARCHSKYTNEKGEMKSPGFGGQFNVCRELYGDGPECDNGKTVGIYRNDLNQPSFLEYFDSVPNFAKKSVSTDKATTNDYSEIKKSLAPYFKKYPSEEIESWLCAVADNVFQIQDSRDKNSINAEFTQITWQAKKFFGLPRNLTWQFLWASYTRRLSKKREFLWTRALKNRVFCCSRAAGKPTA